MMAFIDTSSLIKRYVAEEKSAQFAGMLEKITAVIVAPVTIIEITSALNRRFQDGSISSQSYALLEEEILRNFEDFSVVLWSDELVMVSLAMTRKHHLRTLDAIQLASAIVADAPQLITSDKQLYQAAKKEIKKSILL